MTCHGTKVPGWSRHPTRPVAPTYRHGMGRGARTFGPTAAVAVVGLLSTIVLAQVAMRELDASAQERLDRRASLVTQAVQSEADRYQDALALVAASAGS